MYGLVKRINWPLSACQAVTLVVTAILSGVIWLILRRVAGSNRGQVRRWDRDINE